MNSIFDYLDWRGDLTIDQVPFNEIDAAILARFSYEPFEGIVSDSFRKFVTVEYAASALLNLPDLDNKIVDSKFDIEFIQKILISNRFKNMRMSGFVNDIDLQKQTQFSAVVFDLDEGNYYVAFRGTDSNIVSWKEDLNMGFEFPVPSQEQALQYFELATMGLKEGTFILGGHSKGGNLSIYSAAFCSSSCQDRILNIYNFDGPGFTEQIMLRQEFKAIEHKIKTFVPQFSIVGMILEHMEEYSVVKAEGIGIAQHDVLTWETTRDSFVTLENVDKGSKFIDTTLRSWLSKISPEDRAQFVDTLYSLVSGNDILTLSDLSENRFENMLSVIKNYSSLEDDTKRGVKETLRSLVRSAGKVISTNTIKNK